MNHPGVPGAGELFPGTVTLDRGSRGGGGGGRGGEEEDGKREDGRRRELEGE